MALPTFLSCAVSLTQKFNTLLRPMSNLQPTLLVEVVILAIGGCSATRQSKSRGLRVAFKGNGFLPTAVAPLALCVSSPSLLLLRLLIFHAQSSHHLIHALALTGSSHKCGAQVCDFRLCLFSTSVGGAYGGNVGDISLVLYLELASWLLLTMARFQLPCCRFKASSDLSSSIFCSKSGRCLRKDMFSMSSS